MIVFFLFYYLFLLWYSVNFLSFSVIEIQSIEKFWPLRYIIDFSVFLFGKNDFALRFPQLFFSVLSVVLFYNLSKYIFDKRKDIYFASVIFSLIPGFIISSLIINKSIYIIFLILLFLYFYLVNKKISYFLLLIFVFVDYSFISLYIALIFYSIYKQNNRLLLYSLLLLSLNANYFEYSIGGKPRGYFLDIFGTYILIFSPLVFIYFLYTLYKGFFYRKGIVFFISVTAFILSILFSFRQRIKIDDYAPFVLPYVLYMVKIFLNSYRVRLPVFRKGYKILFTLLFSSLIIFDIMLFLNKYTPARNLTQSFYFIKPLSNFLRQNNINFINCNNDSLCKVLIFYGMKTGNKYKLNYSKRNKKVSIFHKNKKILDIDVSKLNTL